MKSMSNIPCINCITFPICNQIYDIPCKNCITFAVCNTQVSDDFPCADIIDNLMPKCSLIKERIESHHIKFCNKQLYPPLMILLIAKYFKPKKSFVGYGSFIHVIFVNSKIFQFLYRVFIKRS